MGSPEFAQRMRTLTGFQNFLDEIRETPVEVDQWQLEKLALVGVKNELFFYTPGVSKDATRLPGRSEPSTISIKPLPPCCVASIRTRTLCWCPTAPTPTRAPCPPLHKPVQRLSGI